MWLWGRWDSHTQRKSWWLPCKASQGGRTFDLAYDWLWGRKKIFSALLGSLTGVRINLTWDKLTGENQSLILCTCFPGDSEVKASAWKAGDPGWIPGSGRAPGEGNGNPLRYSCHGQRSLAGYSPWGRKESDTTEQLTLYPRFIQEFRVFSYRCYYQISPL